MSAQRVPGLSLHADVFLLAKQCLDFDQKQIDTLVVHEICHWYPESGSFAEFPVPLSRMDHIKGRGLYHRSDKAREHLTKHSLQFCTLLATVAAKVPTINSAFLTQEEVIALAMHYDVEGLR